MKTFEQRVEELMSTKLKQLLDQKVPELEAKIQIREEAFAQYRAEKDILDQEKDRERELSRQQHEHDFQEFKLRQQKREIEAESRSQDQAKLETYLNKGKAEIDNIIQSEKQISTIRRNHEQWEQDWESIESKNARHKEETKSTLQYNLINHPIVVQIQTEAGKYKDGTLRDESGGEILRIAGRTLARLHLYIRMGSSKLACRIKTMKTGAFGFEYRFIEIEVDTEHGTKTGFFRRDKLFPMGDISQIDFVDVT